MSAIKQAINAGLAYVGRPAQLVHAFAARLQAVKAGLPSGTSWKAAIAEISDATGISAGSITRIERLVIFPAQEWEQFCAPKDGNKFSKPSVTVSEAYTLSSRIRAGKSTLSLAQYAGMDADARTAAMALTKPTPKPATPKEKAPNQNDSESSAAAAVPQQTADLRASQGRVKDLENKVAQLQADKTRLLKRLRSMESICNRLRKRLGLKPFTYGKTKKASKKASKETSKK